jgi:two-component system chemotaxis response regulator CheY
MQPVCNDRERKLNFLVVDDSSIMRRIIVRALQDMDCNDIHEADDGASAWDVLQRHTVDFIVCDWNMPGMKGIDFLRKVRESDRFSHIPFLMVSAEAKHENIFQAIEEGVSNYLPKPFKADLLRRKIETILAFQNQPRDPDPAA